MCDLLYDRRILCRLYKRRRWVSSRCLQSNRRSSFSSQRGVIFQGSLKTNHVNIFHEDFNLKRFEAVSITNKSVKNIKRYNLFSCSCCEKRLDMSALYSDSPLNWTLDTWEKTSRQLIILYVCISHKIMKIFHRHVNFRNGVADVVTV